MSSPTPPSRKYCSIEPDRVKDDSDIGRLDAHQCVRFDFVGPHVWYCHPRTNLLTDFCPPTRIIRSHVVGHDHFVRDAEQFEQQGREGAGAILASGAVDQHPAASRRCSLAPPQIAGDTSDRMAAPNRERIKRRRSGCCQPRRRRRSEYTEHRPPLRRRGNGVFACAGRAVSRRCKRGSNPNALLAHDLRSEIRARHYLAEINRLLGRTRPGPGPADEGGRSGLRADLCPIRPISNRTTRKNASST